MILATFYDVETAALGAWFAVAGGLLILAGGLLIWAVVTARAARPDHDLPAPAPVPAPVDLPPAALALPPGSVRVALTGAALGALGALALLAVRRGH